MPKRLELKPSELRRVCDPSLFSFKDTSELASLDRVIGQERAVQAIEFGLDMRSPGYNIFVTGTEGTGKSTIVSDLTSRFAKTQPAPDDWCLVNNFRDEFRPQAIALPPGRGPSFAKKVGRFVNDLKRDIPKGFETEAYLKELTAIKSRFNFRQQAIFQKIERFAAERNLHIDSTQKEFPVVPIVDGKILPAEEYQKLADDVKADIDARVAQIQVEIEKSGRKIEKLNQHLHADIERLMDEVALALVKKRLEPIRHDFKGRRAVMDYLDDLQADIVENFNLFMPAEKGEPPAAGECPQPPRAPFQRYQVNVLVHRDVMKGAPVINENNPTYFNVFGRIEKRAFMGAVNTDFTLVVAGSLLNANGGYLIMEIEPLLMHPYVWESLKRALQTKSLTIEDVPEESAFGTTSLRPEPIRLEVKVVLLGSYEAFEILQNYDSKFNKIFKVRADFDQEVQRTRETEQLYARFIARVCREEKLLPFNPRGVAAIVEFGEKYVSDQNKLSIRFGPLLGVLKEADYWARRQRGKVVSEKHVIRAFQEYRFRYSLYEQKVHESYRDGSIMIDVAGAVVGQINGLAVYQIGEYSFGRPVRITAETFMGKSGVINIEREADLSGSTHDKGVLILSGYLGRVFAQHHALSLAISITFEQSYSDIDGDSASATELYAILSSLSGIPIRQGIAVTGSVNQKGRIQAIGSVNQKVEGFFEVCREKGLTGEQGVIIPSSNVQNLMLPRDVIGAARRKQFHVYRSSTVEEGIEILTGVRAGSPNAEGLYPRGTVFGEVQEKLKIFADRAHRAKQESGATPD
ncbi:MAG: Lon protease family protein [Hyphomicrobiales bacterium]